MTKRLRLLGKDLAALHALIPPASLPVEFGGCATEPRDWLLQDMRRQERETGSIGGWALPLSVEDPTGSLRRAQAAADAAAGNAPVLSVGTVGSASSVSADIPNASISI
jgi:hypothetical protein